MPLPHLRQEQVFSATATPLMTGSKLSLNWAMRTGSGVQGFRNGMGRCTLGEAIVVSCRWKWEQAEESPVARASTLACGFGVR